jgi:hypothetical protein
VYEILQAIPWSVRGGLKGNHHFSNNQACAQTHIGKCEADFYEYLHFHNSNKDLCEFHPKRQNFCPQN